MRRAVQWMLRESGAQPDLLPAPEGVEVYRRVARGHEVFIAENDASEEQTIELPLPMEEVLSGKTVHAVKLPIYGVAVLVK